MAPKRESSVRACDGDSEREQGDDLQAWAAAMVAALPPLSQGVRERLALLLAPCS